MEPDPSARPAIGELLLAIPVKDFWSAKRRMAPELTPASRANLGRALATRAVKLAQECGAEPAIVAAEPGVVDWASRLGASVILEDGSLGRGLNAAAATATRVAAGSGRPWFILHADLPLLQPTELAAALRQAASGRYILCPSYDGGTTGFGGQGTVEFAYGPQSFHRHLSRIGRARHVVYATPGFALDLDAPVDLAVAARRPEGAWLAAVIDRHV